MAKAVSIIRDDVPKVFKSIQALVGKQILVGIPESANHRDEDPINNAAIGYIMEFGSPANNIPARAFLIPGVANAREESFSQLKIATEAALKGDKSKMLQAMNRAGVVASNEVRKMINSNIPPPLAPSTVRGRHYQRGTKGMRESEKLYLELISQGVDPGAAQGETGLVTLVNTGQLRNSITYVMRDVK